MTSEKRPSRRGESLSPSVEFERILSRLVDSETVKQVERTIKTPNSETRLTHEVQVDPTTGQQKLIEKFTTTKKECAICNGYFSQLLTCSECGVQVCANDFRRVHIWSVERDYGYKNMCKTCATAWGTED